VTGVNGTAVFADRSGGYVETTDVTYDGASDTITVSVPASDLDVLATPVTASDSSVDLYIDYTDSAYSSQYENFDSAVLNPITATGDSVSTERALQRFDDGDGTIERNEAVSAIIAYNTGSTIEGEEVTRTQVVQAIVAYNTGEPIDG
jgi:hypothetical protein